MWLNNEIQKPITNKGLLFMGQKLLFQDNKFEENRSFFKAVQSAWAANSASLSWPEMFQATRFTTY